jgi:hypothetical protein
VRFVQRALGRRPSEAPLRGPDGPWLIGAIVSGGGVGPVLLMFGLASGTAAQASLLLTPEGVLTALLAWLVFREHVGTRALPRPAEVTGRDGAAEDDRRRDRRRRAGDTRRVGNSSLSFPPTGIDLTISPHGGGGRRACVELVEPERIDADLGPSRLFARGGLNNFGEIAIDQTALTVRIVDEACVLVTRTIGAER